MATPAPPTPPPIPPQPHPPSGESLSLLTALSPTAASGPNAHDRHTAALAARDKALTSSHESYGSLCCNFARILGTASFTTIPQHELQIFHSADPTSCMQLQHDPTSYLQLRQMAGLLLKNALVSPPVGNLPTDAYGRVVPHARMVLPPEAKVEIQRILLRCILDKEGSVRAAASSCIASTCLNLSYSHNASMEPPLNLKEWKDLCPFLESCLQYGLSKINERNEDVEYMMDGTLLTLRKCLEDNASSFEHHAGPSFPNIIPLLLQIIAHTKVEKEKKEGLKCLNCLVDVMPQSLVIHMNDYLKVLSDGAGDECPSVRMVVCQGIVNLLAIRTEYLRPHLPSISEFMLTATSDTNPTVSIEACEFWLTFASLDEETLSPEMSDTIKALLPRLAPLLLRNMVYPTDKQEELLHQNEMDELSGKDRVQDVAPVFHKSKVKRPANESAFGAAAEKTHHDDDDDSYEDDDDEDDDDDDEEANEWSLRKCSAASLDTLAGMYGSDDILPPLLPALQEGLSHSDPWVREASVLALGAIAEGCSEALAPHMGQLHPFLMSQLTAPDSLPQLKSIAAWTLGRYASWAVEQQMNGAQPDLLGKMTEGLMSIALSPNRKVQIAACSAYGVLVEATGDLMVPYLEPVYRTLVQALSMYQTRSLKILFDTFGIMADFVGPAVGEGTLPSLFVPALLAMWNDLARQNPFDRTLLPLMECLSSTAMATGMNFQPWALETFELAITMIEACSMILAGDEDIDDEEADPIICAADLLDGLVEGLKENFGALVGSSVRFAENFPNVLHMLTSHDVAGVRMSSFALLGDLARQCPTVIQSALPQLLNEAIMCMEPMHDSVCNNAIWAVGEVCAKCVDNPAALQPYAEPIVQQLIPLLMGNAVDDDGNIVGNVAGLAENSAATLGRLAKCNAAFVTKDLDRFLMGWCEGMSKISDITERRDAFEGFILAIRANPQSIQASTHDVADTITSILFAVVTWHIPPDNLGPHLLTGPYSFLPFPQEYAELGQALISLLHDLKTSVGEEKWRQIEGHMPVNVRRLMRECYHL